VTRCRPRMYDRLLYDRLLCRALIMILPLFLPMLRFALCACALAYVSAAQSGGSAWWLGISLLPLDPARPALNSLLSLLGESVGTTAVLPHDLCLLGALELRCE
jgi:hypothetical protein